MGTALHTGEEADRYQCNDQGAAAVQRRRKSDRAGGTADFRKYQTQGRQVYTARTKNPQIFSARICE